MIARQDIFITRAHYALMPTRITRRDFLHHCLPCFIIRFIRPEHMPQEAQDAISPSRLLASRAREASDAQHTGRTGARDILRRQADEKSGVTRYGRRECRQDTPHEPSQQGFSAIIASFSFRRCRIAPPAAFFPAGHSALQA